jgi:hypothetical protein
MVMKVIQFDTETIDTLVDPNTRNQAQLFQSLRGMIHDVAHGGRDITLSLVIKADPVMMYLLPSTFERKLTEHKDYEDKLVSIINQLEIPGMNIKIKIVERADQSSVSFSTEDTSKRKGVFATLADTLTGTSPEKKNATTGVSTYKQAMNQSGQAKSSTVTPEKSNQEDESLTAGSFTTQSNRKIKSYPSKHPSARAETKTAAETQSHSHLPKTPGAGRSH